MFSCDEPRRVVDLTNHRTGYAYGHLIIWHGGDHSNLWTERRFNQIVYKELDK
jgi:hypothetical protein